MYVRPTRVPLSPDMQATFANIQPITIPTGIRRKLNQNTLDFESEGVYPTGNRRIW